MNQLEKRKLYIFGAGNKGIEAKNEIELAGMKVDGFIDNAIDKQGKTIDSIPVLSIGEIEEDANFFIIVAIASQNIRQEICADLENKGYVKGRNYAIWTGVFEHPLGRNRSYNTYKELEQMYKSFVLHDLELTSDDRTLDLIYNLIGTNDGEAIYIRYFLNRSFAIEGDVCEFGIAQGATSALLANEIRDKDKKIWLFDSFEGLSVPTEKDILKDDIFHLGDISKYAFLMKSGTNEVIDRLNRIEIDQNKVEIIPGFIEQSLVKENVAERLKKVCFAYIDFDLYEPILTALQFLHTVTEKGSVIIVDDYDFFSTGAKTAVEEFLQKYESKEIYRLQEPIKEAGHFCIIERQK